MTKAIAMLVCAFALLPAGARAAELVLEGLVARVTVLPEARSDFAVEVRPGSGNLPSVTISREGGRTLLTSGVEVGACARVDGRMQVGLRDGSQAEMSDAPDVIIHAPRAFSLSGGSSGLIGEIGPAEDLDISQSGCAFWNVANVTGTLRAEMSGGARLTASTSRSALLGGSGGAAITTGAVADLVAEASGGGAIRVASVSGAAETTASSGGRIEIESGQGSTLRAHASSGGRIVHRGEVAALHATASAGGQIEVFQVENVVSRFVSAGGQVVVGN